MPDPIQVKVFKQSKQGSILAIEPNQSRVFINATEADDFIKDLQAFNPNEWFQGSVQYCLISPVDWASWTAELGISKRMFKSGHTALALAPQVNLDLPNVDALTFDDIRQDVHYRIDQSCNLYHWETLQAYPLENGDSDILGSADGFALYDDAQRDAQNSLALITAYGVEDGFALMAHYELMIPRMWASDVASINSAVKSVPVDDRYLAAYRMALRTQLMPEQYWPENQEEVS